MTLSNICANCGHEVRYHKKRRGQQEERLKEYCSYLMYDSRGFQSGCPCKKFVQMKTIVADNDMIEDLIMMKPQNQSEWKCKECGSTKKASYPEICHKCYMRKWLNTEEGIKWRKHNSPNHTINNRNYEKRNPEKKKAGSMAKYYIEIPEGQMCQRCEVNFARERHHKDYSKPLEVELLCKSCHSKADMERRDNGKR